MTAILRQPQADVVPHRFTVAEFLEVAYKLWDSWDDDASS